MASPSPGTEARQLVFESPISPAVQAALYQVAAGLPGIKVTDTTDLVGRPAVEVYMEPGPDDPPAVGHALYFSPVTFQLLGEATINAANLSCPVLSSSAILATGYVSSDTQLRRPGSLLPHHLQAVTAGDAERQVREVTVDGPVGGDVDVGQQQVLGVHGSRAVGHANDRQGQLDQPLKYLQALGADLLPLDGLEDPRPHPIS